MSEFPPCRPPKGTPSPVYCWLRTDEFTLNLAELFTIAAWSEGRWLMIGSGRKSISPEEAAKLRLSFHEVIPFPPPAKEAANA